VQENKKVLLEIKTRHLLFRSLYFKKRQWNIKSFMTEKLFNYFSRNYQNPVFPERETL
jgi:hypothetical protein